MIIFKDQLRLLTNLVVDTIKVLTGVNHVELINVGVFPRCLITGDRKALLKNRRSHVVVRFLTNIPQHASLGASWLVIDRTRRAGAGSATMTWELNECATLHPFGITLVLLIRQHPSEILVQLISNSENLLSYVDLARLFLLK